MKKASKIFEGENSSLRKAFNKAVTDYIKGDSNITETRKKIDKIKSRGLVTSLFD